LLLFAIGSQLRAMDIQTGTQSWSTELKGRPVAGVLDPSGVGVDANRIYVIDSQNRFYAIDGETGDIRKEEKLRAHPTGQLSLLPGRGVLVATTDQALELRGLNGRFLKKIQINAGVTTAPVVVKTRRGSLLIVGTRQGLAGFDAATLRPLGLLTLDNGDYPVFGPVTAELDNDEDAELLIITSRGSVAAVDSDLGRLKWIVRVGTGADSLSVVDMDGDGRSDVVIPGNTGSVMALSSLDGSVIWEAEQQSIRESVDSRLLVTQKSKAGRLLLAVRRSSGIAAIELMPGSRH
jgi:outer membrane protein assembly factor BamB